MTQKKGVAFEWIIGVIGLFVVAFIFIIANQVYDSGVYSHADDNFPVQDTDARDVLTIVDTIWNYLPVFFVFMFLFFAILIAQKRSGPFD